VLFEQRVRGGGSLRVLTEVPARYVTGRSRLRCPRSCLASLNACRSPADESAATACASKYGASISARRIASSPTSLPPWSASWKIAAMRAISPGSFPPHELHQPSSPVSSSKRGSRLREKASHSLDASGVSLSTTGCAGRSNPAPLTSAKKAEITRQLRPSGYDPRPLLGRMTVPGIWVYGRQDRSIPAEKSAATLERLRKTQGKDFTVVLFPHAGHGLLDTPPTDPRAMPTLIAWIQKHVQPS
jgi:pimeloyl-ACP methyl ester carboxylesterase